jgi:hypothetical protein
VVGGMDASGSVGVELMPPPPLPHPPRNNPQLNAADRRMPAFVPRMTSALFYHLRFTGMETVARWLISEVFCRTS